MSRSAIFLDKDGTLLEDVPYNVDPAQMRWAPGARDAVRRLSQAGYRLVVVTNQSGIARGLFSEQALAAVRRRLEEMFATAGASLSGFYYCPHHPQGVIPAYTTVCDCRKPAPGLILRAAREQGICPRQSWMIGDTADDVDAGRPAGCRTILLRHGDRAERAADPDRQPDWTVGDWAEAASVVCTPNSAAGDSQV